MKFIPRLPGARGAKDGLNHRGTYWRRGRHTDGCHLRCLGIGARLLTVRYTCVENDGKDR